MTKEHVIDYTTIGKGKEIRHKSAKFSLIKNMYKSLTALISVQETAKLMQICAHFIALEAILDCRNGTKLSGINLLTTSLNFVRIKKT